MSVTERTNPLVRSLVALSLVAALLPAGASAEEGSGDAAIFERPAPTAEDVVAGFGSRIETIRAAASALGSLDYQASAVSVPSLGDTLRGPSEAREWILSNIALDPYEGMMRGARGTLFAMAGNSLDRAVLLGELSEAMGYEWRLAVGTLTDAQARALAVATVGAGELDGDAVTSDVESSDPGADGRRRGVLARHYWTQVRVRGDWVDYDPTFPGLDVGATATEAEDTFAADAVPDAAVRRVSIGVYFETSGTDGGVALSHSSALADVAYRNLTLRLVRDGSHWQPELEVGGERVTGSAIRGTGLRRVWVQYVFATGAAEERVVRDIWRSDAPAGFVAEDAQTHSIVLLPGPVGSDYYHAVLSVLLGGFRTSAAALADTVRAVDAASAVPSESVVAAVDEQLPLALGVSALGFAHASDRLGERLGAALGVRPYFDRPRVLMATAHRSGGSLEFEFDVRSNHVAALPAAGVPNSVVAAYETARGRLDAALVARALESLSGREAFGVDALIAASTDAGASLVTVHPGTVRRLGSLSYGSAAVAALERVVNEVGHFALAPNRAAELGGGSLLAWWEVIPGSGFLDAATEHWGGVHTAFGGPVGGEFSGDVTLMDQTLTALDAVMRGAGDVASEAGYGEDLVCPAACDAVSMRRSLCSDERDRSIPRLSSCLRGSSLRESGSVLPIGTSCSSQMLTFYCGVSTLGGFVDGELAFSPSGPWSSGPVDDATTLPLAACSCGE